MGRETGNDSRNIGETLTRTEVVLLKHLANTGDRTIIAKHLGRSEMTIKSHLRHIYAKLGVNNIARAVAIAIAIGVVRPEEISCNVINIDVLKETNKRWLNNGGSPSISVIGNDDDTPVTVKTNPQSKRRARLQFNGLCSVNLVDVGTSEYRVAGMVEKTLTGALTRVYPDLRAHLGKPWLTMAIVDDYHIGVGRRVTAELRHDVSSPKGSATNLRLSIKWVERTEHAHLASRWAGDE